MSANTFTLEAAAAANTSDMRLLAVTVLTSMDAGDLLPPELSEILARLRADAQPMPMSQLVTVLEANWGKDWTRHFTRFSFTPMAAASIGQVHAAEGLDGRRLAIKVQYPGIARSIASDVDNVATLLRLSGLLPASLDIVFSLPPEERLAAAMQLLGVDFAKLSDVAGHA